MRMNKLKTRGMTPGLLLSGLLVVAPLLLIGAENESAEKDKQVQSTSPPISEQQTRDEAGETAAPGVPKPPSNPQPVKEFKPTEKIGADSAVAFPVDI